MSPHRKDFYYFFALFVLLFLAWLAAGGYERAKQSGDAGNKFIAPPAPIGSGETYDVQLFRTQ